MSKLKPIMRHKIASLGYVCLGYICKHIDSIERPQFQTGVKSSQIVS